MTPPHYVLTGGPCSGKTTLVFELEKQGHAILPEAARMFIEEQLALGKTIPEMHQDLSKFEHDILRRHVELEAKVPKDKMMFFDRGIPDNVAYFRFTDLPIDEELRKALDATNTGKSFSLRCWTTPMTRRDSKRRRRRNAYTVRSGARMKNLGTSSWTCPCCRYRNAPNSCSRTYENHRHRGRGTARENAYGCGARTWIRGRCVGPDAEFSGRAGRG